MPYLLRKLDRKAAFYPQESFRQGDVQADALYDLRTSGNRLSIWHIQSDRDNLNRIIAGMAAKRDSLDKFDYALIDQRQLGRLSIEIVPSQGGSFDNYANKLWHHDLLDLSGLKLVELANTIQEFAFLERATKSHVRQLINDSIDSGFINQNRIANRLKRRLLR